MTTPLARCRDALRLSHSSSFAAPQTPGICCAYRARGRFGITAAIGICLAAARLSHRVPLIGGAVFFDWTGSTVLAVTGNGFVSLAVDNSSRILPLIT